MLTTSATLRRFRPAPLALGACCCLFMQGCATSSDGGPSSDATLASPAGDTPSMATAADRVDELFKLMTPEQRAAARADALGIGPPPELRSSHSGNRTGTDRRGLADAPVPETTPPAPLVLTEVNTPTTSPPAPSAAERATALKDLAGAIVPSGSSATLLQAMQAAAVVAASTGPGAPGATVDSAVAATKLADLEAKLNPTEKNVLAAFRAILTAAADPASKSEADWAKLLAESASALSQAQGLTVTRALLCRRVEAFGKYAEFPSRAFVGGRVQPLLVYVELDHFTHHPLSAEALQGPVPPGVDDTRYEVELAQRIEIRTETGTLVHLERETRTRDISRQRRREFYTVQRIDLPPTLALGAYVLKITVRDLHGGAEAEHVMPITIVSAAAADER